MDAPKKRLSLDSILGWIIAVVILLTLLSPLTGSCDVVVGSAVFSIQFVPWAVVLIVVGRVVRVLPGWWRRAIPYVAHTLLLAVSLASVVYSDLHVTPAQYRYVYPITEPPVRYILPGSGSGPSDTFIALLIGVGALGLAGLAVTLVQLTRAGRRERVDVLFLAEAVEVAIVIWVALSVLYPKPEIPFIGPNPP